MEPGAMPGDCEGSTAPAAEAMLGGGVEALGPHQHGSLVDVLLAQDVTQVLPLSLGQHLSIQGSLEGQTDKTHLDF